MMRHENPELFDAKERYYRAQIKMRDVLGVLGSVIHMMEDRITELTESLIELDKAKEDKP